MIVKYMFFDGSDVHVQCDSVLVRPDVKYGNLRKWVICRDAERAELYKGAVDCSSLSDSDMVSAVYLLEDGKTVDTYRHKEVKKGDFNDILSFDERNALAADSEAG